MHSLIFKNFLKTFYSQEFCRKFNQVKQKLEVKNVSELSNGFKISLGCGLAIGIKVSFVSHFFY